MSMLAGLKVSILACKRTRAEHDAKEGPHGIKF